MKLNQVFCALVSSGAAVLQEDFESLVDDHETPQVVVASREAFGKQSVSYYVTLHHLEKKLLLMAHCFSVEVSHWRHTKSVSRLGLWSVGAL